MLNEHAYNLIMSYINNGHSKAETFQCVNNIFGATETEKIYDAANQYKIDELIDHLKKVKEHPATYMDASEEFTAYIDNAFKNSVYTYQTVYENYHDFKNYMLYDLSKDVLLSTDKYDAYLDEEKLHNDAEDFAAVLEKEYDFEYIYDFRLDLIMGRNLLDFSDFKDLFDKFINKGNKVEEEKPTSVGMGTELLSFNMETNDELSFAIITPKQTYATPCIKVIKGKSHLVIQERYGFSQKAMDNIGNLKVGETYTDTDTTFIRLT